MDMIVGSKLDFKDSNDETVKEFYSYIEDICTNDEFQKLSVFNQHLTTNRLQHSYNVAYYTFLVCRKYNWNVREATRAALLHDFFLYDWQDTKLGFHPNEHPKQALINAKKYFEITPLMENMILSHMWPLSIAYPKYKESLIIQGSDRLCACLEIISGTKQKIKRMRIATSIAAFFR